MKSAFQAKIITLMCILFLFITVAGCHETKKKNDKKEEAKLHYQLGRNHFMRNDYISALRELIQSVEIEPNDPDSQYLIGTVYYMLNRYPEAETHLKEAIRLKKDYPDAYNNLGNVYMAMERWDDAIAQFDICLGFILYQPSFPKVYTNMGIAYVHKGDLKKAEDSFRTAIKLQNRFCPAHLNLADLLSKTDHKDEAIMEYENVVQLCPNTDFAMLAHLYWGIELSAQGKKEDACQHFLEVAKGDPNSDTTLKAAQYLRLLKCQ